MFKFLSCTVLTAAAAGSCTVLGAHAQALPTSFPDVAQSMGADALHAKVAGKSFKSVLSNGQGLRIQYKETGFVFLDMASGFRDTGKWKLEGAKLCVEWQKSPSSGCTEARVAGDVVYMKRTNGEVMTLVPD